MRIDDIIEQHKTDLSKRQQLRKSKSFSNIVWEDYPSSFNDSFWRKIALPLFPLLSALIIPFAFAGNDSMDEYMPGFVISSLFTAFLLPESLSISGSKNTKKIIIFEVAMLVLNLLSLYMSGWNYAMVFWLSILYNFSFYSIFKNPIIKWLKLNKT